MLRTTKSRKRALNLARRIEDFNQTLAKLPADKWKYYTKPGSNKRGGFSGKRPNLDRSVNG